MPIPRIAGLDPVLASQRMTEMTIEGNAALENFLAARIPTYKDVHVARGIKTTHISVDELRKLHPNRFDKNGKLTPPGKTWASLATLAVMGQIAARKGAKIEDVTIGEFVDTYVRNCINASKLETVEKVKAGLKVAEVLSDTKKHGLIKQMFNWVARKVKKSD